ncbi:MAG: DNA mismatch repair protein MutS [Bacteroidetes bacterium]|nr:DNA mismatch repair protein MutS [Bacteroidota bacterium]
MNISGTDTLELFEFDKIRDHVLEYCRCRSSKEKAENLGPVTSRDQLTIMLKQTDEYKQTLAIRGYFPDTFFEDFETEADLLLISNSVLSEIQFSRIRSASSTVNRILEFFKERIDSFVTLKLLAEKVYPTNDIIDLISEIIDAHGLMKNNASPELQQIRSSLFSKRREADKRFRAFINEMKKKGWLRDNEENFYNNRRVLAVPSEYRRDVKGLVHGKSDTGKTTFIEPDDLVELNNDISELEQDERNEIRRLLRELTDSLRVHAFLIKNYHNFLSELDFVRAKALFAIDINANLPQLSKNSIVELFNAVHPLLYLQNKAQHKEVIPLTLKLDQEKRILIISGPNAGGKSITLKTLGLLQLMLQSGLLVSAEEKSQMCFFNHFLADIGDSQSIEYALSTYSSRLIRMNQFLRIANNRSLILIDEFGTGTDPELGGAIAETVLEELNKRKAFGIFTTHYTNIKLLADQLEGVFNGSMLFDPETLMPKYRLIVGQPGSSYTFEVAEKIGLPKHVIDRARTKIKKDKLKLNNMLSELHHQKNQLEEELKALKDSREKSEAATGKYNLLSDKMKEKLEKDNEKREEIRKLVELGRKTQALSIEWEKTKDKKEIIKKFVGSMTAEKKKRAADNTPEKLTKRKKELIEKLSAEIKVGSKVRMLRSKNVGTVEKIKKNIVWVNFGNIMAEVNIVNLEVAEEKQV